MRYRRSYVEGVKVRRPFDIDAWVVLPDHMHAVWMLPEEDADYSARWREIKKRFSKAMPKTERLSMVRKVKGERGIRQRRFWEHTIRDEKDYQYHVDYVHLNPLKHGLVKRVRDWPYLSFRRPVRMGIYDKNLCGDGSALQ